MENDKIQRYFAIIGMVKEDNVQTYRTQEEWAKLGVLRLRKQVLGFFGTPRIISRQQLVSILKSTSAIDPTEVADHLSRGERVDYGRSQYLQFSPVVNIAGNTMLRAETDCYKEDLE